jgi:hypothetical protein
MSIEKRCTVCHTTWTGEGSPDYCPQCATTDEVAIDRLALAVQPHSLCRACESAIAAVQRADDALTVARAQIARVEGLGYAWQNMGRTVTSEEAASELFAALAVDRSAALADPQAQGREGP